MTWTPAWSPVLSQGRLDCAPAMQERGIWTTEAQARLVARHAAMVSGPFNMPLLAAMMNENPSLIVAPYVKSIQNPAGGDSAGSYYPNAWYTKFMDGSKAQQAGTFRNWLMESGYHVPTRTAATTLSGKLSAASISATHWAEHHVKDIAARVAQVNAQAAQAGSHPFRGVWFDSASTFSPDNTPGFWPPLTGSGNPGKNPTTGAPYGLIVTHPDGSKSVDKSPYLPTPHYMGDTARNSGVAGAINTERLFVIGNGLRSIAIAEHFDSAMVEGWILAGRGSTQYLVGQLGSFEAKLQIVIDAQVIHGCVPWLTDNAPSSPTAAEVAQYRRFAAACNLLAKRTPGCTFDYGVTQGTAAHVELAADPALYALDLGAPLAGQSPSDAHMMQVAVGAGTGHASSVGVYARLYAGGTVLVNATGSAITYKTTRAVARYDTGASFAAGASIVVPAGDAVLLTAWGGPADSTDPVVDWQRPTGDGSVPTTQTTQRVFGTITDAGSGPDYVSVNDARVSPDATGYWETLVTLAAAGVGTPITVYGVDRAGNQTTPATRTITRAGDAAGPAFASVTPSQTIPNAQTSITISGVVSDPSGVASLTINGTSATVAGDGSFSRTLTGLAVGDTTVTLVATDAAANTTTLTRTITRSADTTAPVFSGVPADATVPHSTAAQTISGFVSDPEGDAVTLAIGGIPVSVNASTGAFSLVVALSVGANTYQLVATDPSGNTATITRTYTRQAASGDSTPPSFSGVTQDQSVANTQDSITISGRVADASGVATLTANGASVPVTAGAFAYRQSLVVGVNRVTLRATDTVGNIETTTVTITRRATSDVGGGATLGCGSYEVSLWTRGRTRRVGVFEDWTTLEYHRRRGATSDATVTFDAAAVARCCGLIGSVERYEHELVITRSVSSSEDVWEGPVVDWEVTDGAAKIVANDVSRWLSGRDVSQDHDAVEQDAAELAAALVVDAMSRDRSPGVDVSWLPSGILVTRKVLAGQHLIAADVLADLANLGLSWTTRERTILLGGAAVGVAAVALLDDEALVSRPRVAPAADSASVIGVRGAGGGGDAADPVYAEAADAAAVARLGRYVSVVSDDTAATNAQAAAAAARLVSSSADPAVALDALGVAQDAPVTLDLLIPGVLVALSLDGCRPVVGAWRVESVSVSAAAGAESVSVEVDAP